MTTIKRGDVVLVAFPNDDLVTYKQRPVLVVQGNDLNEKLSRMVVVAISSRVDLTGPTRIPVAVGSPEGQTAGLHTDSQIFVDQLATVPKAGVRKVIGRYPAMGEVNRILRVVLGL